MFDVKKIAALLLAFSCAGAMAGEPASTAPDGQVVKAAVKSLLPRPQWANVSIDTRDARSLALTIHYKTEPEDGFATSEADTEALAIAVAQGLAKAGHSPAKESRLIFVYATRDILGVTGEKRVEMLGWALYRPDQDGVTFERKLRGM
ncbi:hypothetical protein G3N59_01115 [Paraburkholderia sp. Ac-20340]|uniref:hypothetical protein n=1 Tax=Paraburkholderia sp. Ac-20340 TaxID=2703888 RepID=UPI00197D89F6|nr:hypothetical protein [Paraburkholderia sp. Ac-20340]MBN3851967.1 hypothetical protein [Paraburkholderia sp. Ac-20340]